jgi:geranylgeranyl diphosphate synthase, type II
MMHPNAWAFDRRRPPLDRIPATKQERNAVLGLARAYVERKKPVPPLSLPELLGHADAAITESDLDRRYRDYIAVLIGNEVWKETVAGFPYDRRLLLLPKCLRSEHACKATLDPYGLLCQRCGECPIGELGAEAERLGYAVMVAEGSPIVMSLIETGKVDAIVGVSCLSVLERVFPYMEAGAVPGIAVPLLNEGCSLTTVDLDWVWDAIHLLRDDPSRTLDLEALRARVESWFTPAALEETLGPCRHATEEIARAWLAKAGKRWRPFLAACAYQAFEQDPACPPPDDLRPVAIAIECFHKASLIHDDIEDGDAERYGEKTLHEEYGVPIALNAGDFLLGEGYRLLAGSSFPAEKRAAMLEVVAEGHRTLAAGQGAELMWLREPRPLSPVEVIDIFKLKTAPAFDVALRVGALCAGAAAELWPVLQKYSAAVGTAYQIRDDLEDMTGRTSDVAALRPSLLLALAHERAGGTAKSEIERLWRRTRRAPEDAAAIEPILAEVAAAEVARELLDVYKFEAIRALAGLENRHLKGLLRRVVGKIFNEVEVMGCCNDYRASNAAGGERGSEAAA